MQNLIRQTIGFLGIEKPYKIILKPRLKGNAAEYYEMRRKGRLVSHLIRVSISNLETDCRDLHTLIVHEFIHAWQAENNIVEVHGREFRRQAKSLGNILNLENIYIKGIDK
jgi:hypothetical protein